MELIFEKKQLGDKRIRITLNYRKFITPFTEESKADELINDIKEFIKRNGYDNDNFVAEVVPQGHFINEISIDIYEYDATLRGYIYYDGCSLVFENYLKK